MDIFEYIAILGLLYMMNHGSTDYRSADHMISMFDHKKNKTTTKLPLYLIV